MRLFRDQTAILIILFNSSSYVSGLALADYNRLNQKALKREIEQLYYICKENGCEIISKTGVGYRLDVENQKLFEAFKSEVERKYYGYYLYRNAQSERVHFIVRQLLVNQDLNIRDFVEKCNYSESTIRRDIPSIKNNLKRYNLELMNKANKGMYIVGDEWDKRLALVRENYIYNKFDKVIFLEKEDIDDVFMNHEGFRKIIYSKLKKIFIEDNYYVSYDGLTDIGDMVLVSLKRRKYSKYLINDDRFSKIDLTREKELVKALFNSIEGESEEALSESDLNYLAVFIKAKKVFRFSEIESMPQKDEVYSIVKGFLQYLGGYFDIKDYDLTSLRKDLCCEIVGMMIRNDFNIHKSSKQSQQFRRDGIINLDMCSLLYRYLKENTNLKCNKYDVVMTYYCFAYFESEITSKHNTKILVVSRDGFFVSRSLANNYRKLFERRDVEFLPAEYMRLNSDELSDINGIITDVDSLKGEFLNIPVIDCHFFRKSYEIKKAVREIIFNASFDVRQLVNIESIFYKDNFENMVELEKFISDNVLKDTDDKEKYIDQLHKREEVYDSRRNNILLLNTIGDYLERSFIYFIALKDYMAYENDCINKVIIYNVASKSIYDWRLVSARISRLIHSYEFVFTGEREEDYLMINKIMFD